MNAQQHNARATSLTRRMAGLGAGVTLLVLFAVIGAVAVERNEAALRISQAPAPSAMVTFTEDGASVANVQVKKGQSVVWDAQDGREHRLALTADSAPAPGFGGNIVMGESGGSYSYAFDQTGTFSYYDALHPERIAGTITVTE